MPQLARRQINYIWYQVYHNIIYAVCWWVWWRHLSLQRNIGDQLFSGGSSQPTSLFGHGTSVTEKDNRFARSILRPLEKCYLTIYSIKPSVTLVTLYTTVVLRYLLYVQAKHQHWYLTLCLYSTAEDTS